MKKKTGIHELKQDRVFHGFMVALWCIVLFIVLYPLYLVLIASISDPDAVYAGKVFLYPVGFSLRGYQAVLRYNALWNSYFNSFVYTISGTLIGIGVTMGAAYATSRKFVGKKIINFIFVLTMFFSGGLIPTFLVMRDLGLYNTPWLLVLKGSFSIWNLMVARTYIQTSLPEEMHEAAEIDGATHADYFFRILLPTCTTIIAVLSVYYGVEKWNNYYDGLVYIQNRKLLPLPTLLREILATLQVTSADFDSAMAGDMTAQLDQLKTAQVAKYCIIVVSTGPAILLYILMQKYFVKGVMIGSLKG